MADRNPLKFKNGKIQGFESGDTTGVTKGGTGLATVAAEDFLFASALDTVVSRGINDFTEDTSPANNDYVLIYDVSAGAHKKSLMSNLPFNPNLSANNWYAWSGT